MKRCSYIRDRLGYCLVELLLVLAILGICVAIGGLCGAGGLRTQEARGAAQAWQTASAWAQSAVLWHGAAAAAEYSEGAVSVIHSAALCGGIGLSVPRVAIDTNVPRWSNGAGWTVIYGGGDACPDSGGSLYFDGGGAAYRVVVRPESGLTARSRSEVAP